MSRSGSDVVSALVGAVIASVGAGHLFWRAAHPRELIQRHFNRTGIDLLAAAADKDRYVAYICRSNRIGGIVLGCAAGVLWVIAVGLLVAGVH